MRRIKATYKIITPMFISGENQKICELRPPSFKGVLRFWYRAIAFPYYKNNWQEVKKREKQLFGSTSGKSKISITINHNICREEINYKIRDGIGVGLSYLGYGFFKIQKGNIKQIRCSIKPNTTFTVVLSLNSAVSDEEKELIIKSLQAISLFGGMGSRTRNGFGSVNLVSLQDDKGEIKWCQPTDINELKKTISKFWTSMELSSELPEYTAFCTHSAISIITPSRNYKKAWDFLNEIGEEMIKYRSYGRNGKLPRLHARPERNFRGDHDIIYDFINKICINNPNHNKIGIDNHPERVVFGLPHNYFIRKRGTDYQIKVTPKNTGRRASPLFIHIHEINKNYYAIISFLPAKFLPKGEKIIISGEKREKETKKRTKKETKCKNKIVGIEDFQPVVNFIDRFKANEVFRIDNKTMQGGCP
ncbi:MAG: type III-B CRISPR module RAMP protein Cmr1 [Acetivibrionales bacterium]|jgi:CRISPR-associated protein Cmr1